MGADPEGGEDADEKHPAPGLGSGEEFEKHGVADGGDGPADGPAGLGGADGAASEGWADVFSDENGDYSPLTAESEALQAAGDEELREGVSKSAEEGEDGEPDDGELEDADAAVAVCGEAG